MHETVVAQGLLDQIIEQAGIHRARPVSAKISCGLLNAVNDEVLAFAFETIAKGTICQGLTLVVDHKSMQAHCRNCGREFELAMNALRCTNCGSDDFQLLPDSPILLEEIEFEED